MGGGGLSRDSGDLTWHEAKIISCRDRWFVMTPERNLADRRDPLGSRDPAVESRWTNTPRVSPKCPDRHSLVNPRAYALPVKKMQASPRFHFTFIGNPATRKITSSAAAARRWLTRPSASR